VLRQGHWACLLPCAVLVGLWTVTTTIPRTISLTFHIWDARTELARSYYINIFKNFHKTTGGRDSSVF
jgi:hypothetical protein